MFFWRTTLVLGLFLLVAGLACGGGAAREVQEAPRAAPQPTYQPMPAVGAEGLEPPAAVSLDSVVPGRSPLKTPTLAAAPASPVPPVTEGLPVSLTLETPAAESASLPLGGRGLPSYLSDAERDCLGGQDVSLGVGWLVAGAPGAADVLPCLSDRSLNRMVYLDSQVDSSGVLLGAVDCLDQSPIGPALHRILSEFSQGGAASGALQDRVLGVLLSTSFTVGECLTPGEYRALGLSAVWDYDTMLCVLEGAGGSAALVDAMSSGGPGGFGKTGLGIEECWESGGGVFGEPLDGGEPAASSPVWECLGEDPTRARRETADRLSQMRAYNPALVGRIMEMPFMATHEPADTGAVAALAYLSIRDPAMVDSIMAHSSLAGGITDGQTHAVALAYGSVSFGGSATRTLESGLLHVTSLKGRLPLSGPVSITVATERPAETGHLHLSIERWLGWLEEYLETPLPTANVLVHYGRGLPSPATGGNVGVSIIHPPGYAAPAKFHWTQHELVHYWFVGNEGWIDEGLAQALTSLMEADGTAVVTPSPRSRPCSGGGKIVDTIGATPQGSVADWCTYNLGELFMLTLYDKGGPEAFRRGAGALAVTAQARAYPPLGLEDVRAAFAHIPEALGEAERRWYHR